MREGEGDFALRYNVNNVQITHTCIHPCMHACAYVELQGDVCVHGTLSDDVVCLIATLMLKGVAGNPRMQCFQTQAARESQTQALRC